MPRLVQYWIPRLKRARRRRGRPAVALDQQRRLLLRRRRIVGIVRRVEQPECRLAARGRELHALDAREVVGDAQVGALENVGRLLQDRVPAGGKVEHDDAGGMIGGAGAKHHPITRGPHRAEFRERRVEREQSAVAEVEHGEPPKSGLGTRADDAIGPGEGVGRRRERPLRQSELRRHRRQRPRRPRRQFEAIEVPPAGTIGHEHDARAVGRPFRLEDRFRRPARDQPGFAERAMLADFGEVEHGAVPRHVGMIPSEPGEPFSVGRQPRRRVEVVPAREHASGTLPALGRVGGGEVDGDDGIDRLAGDRVILAHAEPALAARVDHAVGKTPLAPARGRRGRQRLRLGARCLAIETAVGEVGEIDHPVLHRP